MNTNELIQLLSSKPLEKPPLRFSLRISGAVIIGGSISFLLLTFILGIRPELLQEIKLPEFWIKFCFALALVGVGLIATTKTSRPGKQKTHYFHAVITPIMVMWLIGTWFGIQPNSASLLESIEGSTWQACSLLIALLSTPIFIAVFWSLKSMAPVRPRLTGFMAGLFSGGISACIYCLHCPELSPIFVGVWYLIGMLIPATMGAILGKKFLNW